MLMLMTQCYIEMHAEDGNHIASNYSVLLLGLHFVTYMCRCYNYFYIMLDYSQIILIIPKLFQNTSRIVSAIKIPKIIPA